MAVDTLKLKQIYETLRSDRSKEEVVWDEIEKFNMPLTGKTSEALDHSTPDQKTSVALWDLTAPLALEHLAAALHSDVTSPNSNWLDLEWEDAEVEKDHDAIVHREKIADMAWSELQASDFNMEISSGYIEWAGIGNMALVCEPTSPGLEWKGLDFTAVPCRQVQFQEDSRGGVHRWFRALDWTPLQIVDHCEKEKNADGTPKYPAPEKYKKLAEVPGEANKKITIIFCIFRRDGIADEVQGRVIPDLRPFGCVYFPLEDGVQLGEEGGYYRMPAVMARWGKRPGTQWGYGRGHIALRAVKGLNYFKELQLAAGEKAVDPAMGATERVGNIDLRPGKTSVMPSKEDLWTIESSARFDVSAEIIRDDRVEIRRCFHEDDLQLKESPQMTATEVQARKDQMNRALGSPVARLQSDALAPIVMMVIDHLARAGRLPPPPEIVRRKKAEFKLRFRGPIARAAVMDQVVAIERVWSGIANLMKLGLTEARHYLDLGASLRLHAKLLGAPTEMLNSDIVAKQGIAQERAAAAAAQQASTMKDAGQGAAAAASAAATLGTSGPVPLGAPPALLPSGGVAA